MGAPVELTPEGRPLVKNYNEFASRFITISLALLCYLGPLSIGFNFHKTLFKSPLVKFVGKIMGFTSSAVSWVPAYFMGGVVFGQWEFAKRVFKLYTQTDYAIAMGLVFLSSPFSIFLIRTIKRTAVSYFSRTLIFFVSLILTFMSLATMSEYIGGLYAQEVYIFSCVVAGLVYFTVFMNICQIRKPQDPPIMRGGLNPGMPGINPSMGNGINPGIGSRINPNINPSMNPGEPQNPFGNLGGGQGLKDFKL